MGYYLFEDPTVGITIAIIVEVFLVISWWFMRERFNRLVLLVGPVIAASFIFFDLIVQTNREELEENTRIIVQAAEDENAQGIIDLLSDKFLFNKRLDKAAAADIIRWHLAQPLIAKNHIRELLIKSVDDQSGQVEFEVITNIDPKSIYGLVRLVKTRWQFNYVRGPDGRFRVVNMSMLKFGEGPGLDVFKKQKLQP